MHACLRVDFILFQTRAGCGRSSPGLASGLCREQDIDTLLDAYVSKGGLYLASYERCGRSSPGLTLGLCRKQDIDTLLDAYVS